MKPYIELHYKRFPILMNPESVSGVHNTLGEKRCKVFVLDDAIGFYVDEPFEEIVAMIMDGKRGGNG